MNKEGKENFIVKQLIINMKKIFHLTFLLIVSQLTSQQTPASLTEESILFIGATAHIGNGTIIENSAIGIRNGKITEVTTEVMNKLVLCVGVAMAGLADAPCRARRRTGRRRRTGVARSSYRQVVWLGLAD